MYDDFKIDPSDLRINKKSFIKSIKKETQIKLMIYNKNFDGNSRI